MKTLFKIVVVALMLWAFLSSCVSSNRIKEGWYNERELNKAGYCTPKHFKGRIYIRATKNSSKVNIKPIK